LPPWRPVSHASYITTVCLRDFAKCTFGAYLCSKILRQSPPKPYQLFLVKRRRRKSYHLILIEKRRRITTSRYLFNNSLNLSASLTAYP